MRGRAIWSRGPFDADERPARERRLQRDGQPRVKVPGLADETWARILECWRQGRAA